MLIISKFRDYYDNAIGYGVDKKIVYSRKQNTLELDYDQKLYKDLSKILQNRNDRIYRFKDLNAIVRPFFIGFCGKIYQGYNYIPHNSSFGENIYGFDKSAFPKEILELRLNKYFSFRKDDFKTFADLLEQPIYTLENESIFKERNAPAFFFEDHARKTIFIDNPCLSNYQFQKIMDSTTAFQEISMFISGALGVTEKEIVQISDKDKILAHGFDNRSFRKEPKH